MLFSFFLLILVTFVQTMKIHELMTEKEIFEIFGTTHENVPDYEVVTINHSINKRSSEKTLKTRFFGQYFILDLTPAKNENFKYTKVWRGNANNSLPTGIKFTYLYDAYSVHIENKIHRDVKRSASFVVNEDKNGYPLFDGTIGGKIAIRSIPERLRSNNNLTGDFNFVETKADSNLNTTHSHLMYHIKQTEFENLTINSTQQKPNIQMETLYPEIMVIMDEILFRRFDNDPLKAVEYIVLFWHGIDMRFTNLINPNFKLSLVQIVLMEDTLPFVKNSSAEGNIMIANNTIEAMRDYFYQLDENAQFRINDDYDLAMLMTGYDMSFKLANGWDRLVHGVAHVGGACRKANKMITATGIFEDNGGFRGIITGYHELAHLLGANHDRTDNATSKFCLAKEGYVMGGQFGQRMFFFSKCSIAEMQQQILSGKSPCMKNVPLVKNSLPNDLTNKYKINIRLPGQFLSLREQCNGNTPCYEDERVCLNLCCKNDAEQQFWKIPLYKRAPAADGSPCGDGKICFSGFCMGVTPSIKN
ncbi:venom metalloproteinase 3-like isoform X2 [Leptopilina heterotoma]|uniref:venom metalloproteinase 3-like isoform X2 n=1 Tax=Leptopilina heterotoma TaxID=63436 RepID=UPI001CA8DF4E|nr:venom metalloproteinase 3-like isoform X2 [Leptopilina heterotoma]